MNESAFIAFLPASASWVKQDFPHMTLVYGGPIADRDISDLNAMGKDAISAARAIGTFSLNVVEVEELGDEDSKVDVLTLYPTPQLLVARQIVEDWDTSEFKDFKPHVTIGPVGSAYAQQIPADDDSYGYSDRRRSMLPTTIFFNRLAICWGEKRLIFDLSNFN